MPLEWFGFDDLSSALLYRALQFRQAVFIVEQGCAYPDLDGLDQQALHLLARSEEILAGYLRLIPHPAERRVAIGRLAVAPGLRRRGLARQMMMAAITRCRRDRPDCAVTLSAQTCLVGFYGSLGFAAVSAPYDDYGIPHIDMRLLPR